jgi:GTPase SAR1 family protein
MSAATEEETKGGASGESIEELTTRLNAMPYEIFENNRVQIQDFLFKLIIIGDSAVGKSCLLHRLTNNEFVTDHEVTVGVEFGTLLVKLEQ